MITLVNGGIQNPSNVFVPNGYMTLQLNVDATIIATPFGIIPADLEVVFQFDETGNLIQPAQIYSNLELNPQNNIGLGTYYLVTFYDSNSARINKSPMWWQFPQVAGSTVNISEITPFATVGGNVIYYPTTFVTTEPGPSTLGGVFSNPGLPNEFVTGINTDGTVSLAQPSFANLSGQITASQIPAGIVFTTATFSGLITASGGIEAGSGTIDAASFTSGGIPFILQPLGSVYLTSGLSITPTTFFSAPAGGVYRVSITLYTVSAGTGGTVTATISWEDAVQSHSVTTSALDLTQNSMTVSFTENCYSRISAFNYSTTVSGASGSPVYALAIRVEYLG